MKPKIKSHTFVVPHKDPEVTMWSLWWDEGVVRYGRRPIIAWSIELWEHEDGDASQWISPITFESETANERRLIEHNGEFYHLEYQTYDTLREAMDHFEAEMKKEEGREPSDNPD